MVTCTAEKAYEEPGPLLKRVRPAPYLCPASPLPCFTSALQLGLCWGSPRMRPCCYLLLLLLLLLLTTTTMMMIMMLLMMMLSSSWDERAFAASGPAPRLRPRHDHAAVRRG